MARWFRFTAVGRANVVGEAGATYPFLVNMDQHVLVRPPRGKELESVPEGASAIVVGGEFVLGDVEDLALALGAESFGPKPGDPA